MYYEPDDEALKSETVPLTQDGATGNLNKIEENPNTSKSGEAVGNVKRKVSFKEDPKNLSRMESLKGCCSTLE